MCRGKWCAGSSDDAKYEAEKDQNPDQTNCDGREADEKKIIGDVEVSQTSKEILVMRRLASAYCRLNNQITVNETAIDDSRVYVRGIKDVDGSQASESQKQVKELLVLLNEEKRKRSVALVDLVAYSWRGKETTLLSLVEKDSSALHRSKAKHDKLVTTSLRLEDKYKELEKLDTQFNDQVQLAKMLPHSVTELTKLRELSDKLLNEQEAMDLLKRDQQDILLCFVRGDDETRNVMKELFYKSSG